MTRPIVDTHEGKVRLTYEENSSVYILLYDREVVAVLDYYHDEWSKEDPEGKYINHPSKGTDSINTGDPDRERDTGLFVRINQGMYSESNARLEIVIKLRRRGGWKYMTAENREESDRVLEDIWNAQISLLQGEQR